MNKKVEDINTKNLTYYFFNDIINIKFFNPNDVKIDKKSYKNINIYYVKKYVKINSVNPFHFIFKKVNGYFEEINGNKYLTLVPTNESKEKRKKKKKNFGGVKSEI